ncbi:head maturation protease, ClpP-related [Lysinibacillus parviboronicapiens]|uniref:head maturation protease, ClpP-related n=1 Tax=Lysinibacillus parviboronicapiens TaxID=436516 RepID=UPI0006CF5A06|nr:head maturation protease, ClpP-related [Lysinibacillus parviboronicapiens]
MTVQANKRRRRFKNSQYEDLVPEIPKNFTVEVDEDNDETVLTIYGDIGESWWYDSTSANDIDRALKQVKTSNISVRLNSPGGDAFDGIAIYNRLKDHQAKVKIIVDGWACSAASIMAMAADELIMNMGAMIMVHEAWTIAVGSKTEMQKTIDMMVKLDESLLDIYMTKAQITRDEMKQFVINETWFTADEAVAIGFATATEDTKDEEADKANAEAYKNNVLARFKQEPIQQPNNVLNKFQRNSTE